MVAIPLILPFLISVQHGGTSCDCTILDIISDMVVLPVIVPFLMSVNDANLLFTNELRQIGQKNKFQYGETTPREQLVLCDIKEAKTQSGGERPFGVSILSMGQVQALWSPALPVTYWERLERSRVHVRPGGEDQPAGWLGHEYQASLQDLGHDLADPRAE